MANQDSEKYPQRVPFKKGDHRLAKDSSHLPAISQNSKQASSLSFDQMKQCIVQEIGHRRILGLGEDVHHRFIRQAELDKEEAVKAAKIATKEKCNILKQKALDELAEELKLEKEQAIKKLAKEHQSILHERILETETIMAKENLEALEAVRAEAEESLEAAVKETERKLRAEMEVLEERVQKFERQRAADEIKALKRIHAEKLIELEDRLLKHQEEEINELKEKHKVEIANAVSQVQMRERAQKTLELQNLKKNYENQLEEMRQMMVEQDKFIETLHQQIQEEKMATDLVEEELLQVGREFSEFVHRIMGAQDGDAEYLLPTKPLVREILDKRGLLRKEMSVRQKESRVSSAGTVSVTDPKYYQLLTPHNKIDPDFY